MSNHPNRSRKTHGATANPTPAEIVARRKKNRFTQSISASLVHTTTDTWKKWEAGTVRMHPAIWELFVLKTV